MFIHPTALVETASIGPRTRVWAFTHILAGAEIGADCNIGGRCYIEGGVRVGDRVTVKNANALWEGVTLEDALRPPISNARFLSGSAQALQVGSASRIAGAERPRG